MEHHGTSARLANIGGPTGRSLTHAAAHKARADSHQINLCHGHGGVLFAGTANVLSRDAGVGRGESVDPLLQEARSSPAAPPPSPPSAWSLPARDASQSTSSLAPVPRSPSASSLADESRWLLLCPARQMAPTHHGVEHLVCRHTAENGPHAS